jgi:hypothetical protein
VSRAPTPAYQPGPVTLTFGMSGSGSWIEPSADPNRTLQPAAPR